MALRCIRSATDSHSTGLERADRTASSKVTQTESLLKYGNFQLLDNEHKILIHAFGANRLANRDR